MRTLLQTLLLCLMTVQLHAQCQEQDYIALRALYLSTDGDNWYSKDSTDAWPDVAFFTANPTMPAGTDVSTWYGVGTDADGCVICIDMDGNPENCDWENNGGNNLTGNIPPEFGALMNLERLRLMDNTLSGSIPPEIGNLSNLIYLNLVRNELSGEIPPEIINLTNLQSINLGANELVGNILPEFGNLSSLTNLNLSYNNLTGSIPSELGNLNNLEQLSLSNNQLSGSIPPGLGQLGDLIILLLYNNQLSGSIPPDLGNLSNLRTLHLHENQLSGSIPPELGQLGDLERLFLYDNELSGSLPPELGNLGSLRYVNLSENSLSGSIPPEIGNLSNLIALNLALNQLSGEIPLEIVNLTNLEGLTLSSNDLIGNIPPGLSTLSNLTSVSLGYNELTGNIPPELAQLSNLQRLWLGGNQLSGSIPPELGNLSDLIELYLFLNDLSGSIPSELGNLSSLTDLRLYDNQLSGCYDPNLLNLCNQLDSLSNNNESISDGNNFDAPWEGFCATGTCDINLVLPGDCNNDFIVDGLDILYWALAYGYTGAVRSNASTDWIPQPCAEWSDSIDGVNSKYQDANGDGTIDELDLDVIYANFGATFGNNPFEHNPTDAMLVPEELEVDDLTGQVSFEVHTDTPISAHAISFTINLGTIPNIDDIQININGSALDSDDYYIYIDDNGNIHVTLIRTDKMDQTIDGLIVSSVVIVDDFQSLTIGDGYSMSTKELTAIGGSTSYSHLGGSVSLGLNHAYCDEKGTAKIYMAGASSYNCEWSTGETTTSIENLDPGNYTVMVSDGMDMTEIPFNINWAFTPVEININNNQIDIDFEEAPLSEEVEISLDGGSSYMPPIMNNNSYSLTDDTYEIFIRRMSDECLTHIRSGSVSKSFSPHLINSLGEVPRLVYKLEEHGTVDISLYNIHKQRLRTIYHTTSGAGAYQIAIDKGDLPRGIYFIHVVFISNDGTTTYKTLKLLI